MTTVDVKGLDCDKLSRHKTDPKHLSAAGATEQRDTATINKIQC